MKSERLDESVTTRDIPDLLLSIQCGVICGVHDSCRNYDWMRYAPNSSLYVVKLFTSVVELKSIDRERNLAIAIPARWLHRINSHHNIQSPKLLNGEID